MPDTPAPFDDQASTYDERVGLSDEVCREIAAGLVEISDLGEGDLIVEGGAGTGEIGFWIRERADSYVGFDLSRPMIDAFRKRIGTETRRSLTIQADGNLHWPLADACARVIFGSRTFHLMDPDHVVREVFRLAAPRGAVFLIGRVLRDKNSVKARMRKEMRRLLQARGGQGREGEANRDRILATCCERGATEIQPRIVSSWTVRHCPKDSIRSWKEKEGLAGITPPPETKRQILESLGAFAESEFGGIDTTLESVESYILEGASLPSTQRRR